MLRSHKLRLFAAIFALLLTSVLGVSAYMTSAIGRGAEFFVFGPSTARCDRTGQTVTAGFQDAVFGLELQQFQASEPVFLSFTFPDGRVFSAAPASVRDPNSLDPTDGRNGLDAIIDMPANFPWWAYTSTGGDFYYTFPATNRWPYGCYTFTALGAYSNRQAQASFVVAPRTGGRAPNPGPATLVIEDNTTGDPSGLHGATVNIFGRGFRAREVVSIWITKPDGTVFSYPYQPIASDIGSVAETFIFDEVFPVGRYAFTALGNNSGYQVIGYFDLASRPSRETGWAQLRVAFPYPANVNQRAIFEIQGKRFDPYERVDIWTTLPGGAVRGLPSQYANEFGEFFAIVDVDERLPTGNYSFTAKGASSGRLVITQLSLTPGSPNVTDTTPELDPVPQVIRSNDSVDTGTPDTLGPPDF